MKRIIFSLILLTLSGIVSATGVGVVDATKGLYLKLDSSRVTIHVTGQIATTTTLQYFRNTGAKSQIKYAFPIPEQASATDLSWFQGSSWYKADIQGIPQDTTLPGSGNNIHPNLQNYLGLTPLFFSIPDSLKSDSILVVSLTYVELLPYKNGLVKYIYPNNYQLIQPSILMKEIFDFSLNSPRTIEEITLVSSQVPELIENGGNQANIYIERHQMNSASDYVVNFRLNSNELGLFGYSAWFQDEFVPDTLSNGFLTFIAEPNPADENTISKVFTLIIDRSGSMYGSKMEQARDAAKFIVSNLNDADMFNLIDFDDYITSFKPGHVPATLENRQQAEQYINSLSDRGMTNISGAFEVAIPQFSTATDTSANIIVFMTDGQPTAGITNQEQLVTRINELIATSEKRISLFSFGIGNDVDKILLSKISNSNNGFSTFLENDELLPAVTDFYSSIRNPVLLDTKIKFIPDIVSNIVPDSLPNLYKGQQMIVAARYNHPQTVNVVLSGTAFGKPVQYTYPLNLSEGGSGNLSFLQKVWAKQKIESLMLQYFTFQENSEQALALKNSIIAISKSYGIITSFSSFSGGIKTGVESNERGNNTSEGSVIFELVGNYPNPFNPETTIEFRVNSEFHGDVQIRIYSLTGQLIRTLTLSVSGSGAYKVVWDGRDSKGKQVSSGVYFYSLNSGNYLLIKKMTLIK